MKRFLKDNVSLLAVSWGHFVNDFFMSVVPVVLFAFAKELDLNATQMSLILFAITTAGTFFQPLVGLLIDRIQKSSLLIYSLIGITLGMSLSGLIRNFYLLIIVVAIAALGSSIYHPLGSTITIHKTGLSRGKSLSIFMTVGSFAHTVAPMVAIPLVTIYGLNSLAILLIPGFLSALLLYAAKVHKVTWTKEEKKADDKKSSKNFLTKKQQLYLSIPMSIAIVKGVLYRVTIVFGVIIMSLKGVSTVKAAIVISSFMFARATATFIGGFISDYIGERNTLKIFNGLAFLSVALIVYGDNILMILGFVVLGFSINATAAANITITHKIVPENINYGTGLIMGFSATLSAVVMLGYGALVDLYGHLIILNVLVAMALFMTILSFIIPKEFQKN